MKKLTLLLSLVLVAVFAMVPLAYATKDYNSSKSNTFAIKHCGGVTCQGDIIGGKLYLINKANKRVIAPPGTYKAGDGKAVTVGRDGLIIKGQKKKDYGQKKHYSKPLD